MTLRPVARPRVAVVGARSLIATALRAHPATADWLFLSHDQALADTAWMGGRPLLLNCALDPRLRSGPYAAEHDVDLRLAQAWVGCGVGRDGDAGGGYVMLSSRLAYGPAPADGWLREDQAPRPDRPYGIAKWQTEQALQALLGARLTVLRLANVFGAEDLPGRQSFFAIALRSLRTHGRIVLDMHPEVARDFIPLEAVADALVRVAQAPRPGLYNLGSGLATPTGQIADWLIEGCGRGERVVSDPRWHDAFCLDVSRGRQAFGWPVLDRDALRQRCLALGRTCAAG